MITLLCIDDENTTRVVKGHTYTAKEPAPDEWEFYYVYDGDEDIGNMFQSRFKVINPTIKDGWETP